jgi:hypothetical protein
MKIMFGSSGSNTAHKYELAAGDSREMVTMAPTATSMDGVPLHDDCNI